MTLALGAGWVVALVVSVLSWARGARARGRVARACHELRGPLNALSLGLSLASRTGALPPARVRALSQELARATEALGALSGSAVLRFEEVPVGALLADSVEAWRPLAGERSLALDIGRAGGAVVSGSRARLAQATGNLIQNAIEHGDGGILVRARVTGDRVRIEVLDGGGGLGVPLVRLLRERSLFAWPPAGDGRGHGLRIVAEIARAHGGRLSAAPSEQGARIVLELPLAQRAAATGTEDP